MTKLPASFFNQDTCSAAQALLGKVLVYHSENGVISGIISETEAYTQDDPACHAFNGHQTPRNAPMFQAPGTIYIYFIYGMYHCLNFVTEAPGRGCAVLIRGVQPLDGVALMRQNRPKIKTDSQLANGPGKLMLAFDIDPKLNGQSITDPTCPISIEDRGFGSNPFQTTPRIGISKGKEHHWRYILT